MDLVDFFISPAWAQQAGGESLVGFFVPLILIFVIFYFLLIRPQTKRQKEHRQMVDGLASGDEVVTGGGVLGKVTEVGEQFITVEVAPNVSLKVQKHSGAGVLPKGTLKSA